MEFSNSILFGILRLCCLLLFIYYINKRWINTSRANSFIHFIVHQWFLYGSLIGIVIFITTQLSIYNLLNCIIILLTIIFVDVIGYKGISHLEEYLHKKVKSGLHAVLKSIELKRSIKNWLEFKRKSTLQKNVFLTFFILFSLGAITFVNRILSLKFDSYSLSNIWNSDLISVINFDNQNWFDAEMTVRGNMAFVNFYSKVINVSPEIALQSVGLLESILIVIILFWVTRSVTTSRYFAPLISALVFALFYTIIPLNLNYLLQPKSTFLALTFALPAMVYVLKPSLLGVKKGMFFLGFSTVFFVIGLIDIFVLYILLPPFLLLSVLLTEKRSSRKFWFAILAYITSGMLIAGLYFVVCYKLEIDFFTFLSMNLVEVDSYTYLPQLIMPLNKLLIFYLLLALFSIVILLKFIFYNKEDMKGAVAFLGYFIVLLLIFSIKNTLVDFDLLIQSLAVFMPIVIGITASIIIRPFRALYANTKFENYKYYTSFLFIMLTVYLSIDMQQNVFENHTQSNKANKDVLVVYNNIINSYLPYSYAVVNDYSTQVMSENEHFFLNYSTFLNGYSTIDSIYFKNERNHSFLKKHPEYIIPKSVFLFVYNDKDKELGYFKGNKQFNAELMKLLMELKNRGRRIKLFCENENFKVYEIVNVPRSSRVAELIY